MGRRALRGLRNLGNCEINPLEMVWGRSKYHYRLKPPSTKEEDLEANMIASLEVVTIDEMRRYLIFSS